MPVKTTIMLKDEIYEYLVKRFEPLKSHMLPFAVNPDNGNLRHMLETKALLLRERIYAKTVITKTNLVLLFFTAKTNSHTLSAKQGMKLKANLK
jgi:hypothetical protein